MIMTYPTFIQIFAAISISIIFGIIGSVWLLSSGISAAPFGSINNPLSMSIPVGLGVGLVHGIILVIVLWWLRPESLIRCGIAGIVTTELLIALGFCVAVTISLFQSGRLLPFLNPVASMTSKDVYYLFVTIGFWFLLLSLLLLIPSILIGLLNRLVTLSWT